MIEFLAGVVVGIAATLFAKMKIPCACENCGETMTFVKGFPVCKECGHQPQI